jgi:hypothetical protein
MGLVARTPALQESPATADQEEQPAREQPPPRDGQPRIGASPGRRDVPLTSIVADDPKELGPVTPQTGVADVLLGSIALIAAILVAGLVLGLAGGALRVYILHKLGFGGPEVDEADHIRLAIGRVTSDKGAPRQADTSSPRAESQSHPSSNASQASTPSDGRLLG